MLSCFLYYYSFSIIILLSIDLEPTTFVRNVTNPEWFYNKFGMSWALQTFEKSRLVPYEKMQEAVKCHNEQFQNAKEYAPSYYKVQGEVATEVFVELPQRPRMNRLTARYIYPYNSTGVSDYD